MQELSVVVDARATQEGFKQHKHRGIGHYAYNLLRRLPESTSEFHFSYLVDNDLPLDREFHNGKVDLLRHRTDKLLASVIRFLEAQWTLPRTLRSHKFDFIHYLAHQDAALATPGPYIITLHDTIEIAADELYKPIDRVKHNLIQLFFRLVVSRAIAIITESEYSKKDIIKHFQVDDGKITVIQLSADFSFFKEHSAGELEKLRLKYDLPKDFILYVGGIDPRKNIKTLFKALSILHNHLHIHLPLAFAGNISGQREFPEIMDSIKEEKLETSVRLLGYVADEDLPRLYAASRAFVFPSLYEGFGLPVLQALAAGTPVVTSTRTSIPEVAGAAALYVDPLDPQSIADGIQAVLQDQELAHQLIVAGKEQARKFSWDQTVHQTLDVYRQVAKKLMRQQR